MMHLKTLAAVSGLILGLISFPAQTARAQFNFGFGSQQPSRTQPGDRSPYPDNGRRPIPNGSPRLWQLFDGLQSIPVKPRQRSASSPREQFEQQFQQASAYEAVQLFESLQAETYSQYLGVSVLQASPSVAEISWRLGQIAAQTGRRPAFMITVALEQEAHTLVVLPSNPSTARTNGAIASSNFPTGLLAQTLANTSTPPVLRRVQGDVSRERLLKTARDFRRAVSDRSELDSQTYLTPAQQLYQWIVADLEPQLRANNIDTLLFSMDDGLRSIPFAALHDGRQFLAERYSTALLPSFGLTNTYSAPNLVQRPMLAMGVTKSTQGLSPLPAVASEIATITEQLWTGPSRSTLDERSTLSNLKTFSREQRFSTLHLATHAIFQPGSVHNSYIQFWDSQLTLPSLRQLAQDLEWPESPTLELLVLSACQTALGSKEAELGFAGTAVNAGVASVVASLWTVEDQTTLDTMTGFYRALPTAPTKSAALQAAQRQLMYQTVSEGWGAAPTSTIRHPYYWAAYTVIGNWH